MSKNPSKAHTTSTVATDPDLSVSNVTQLLSILEPPHVAQARPMPLTSVSRVALKSFVTTFKNYKKLGGNQLARSFLHSDVIRYFATVISVDLTGDTFDDSEEVLAILQRQYAPKRFDYITLLKSVAMKASDPDTFDNDAVNDYLMRYLTCLDDHSAIRIAVEEDVITDLFFSGILPHSLRVACKSQKIKTLSKAIKVLTEHLDAFETHQLVATWTNVTAKTPKPPKPRKPFHSGRPESRGDGSLESKLISQVNRVDSSADAATIPPRNISCKGAHHWKVCSEECRGACPRNSASHVPKDCPARNSKAQQPQVRSKQPTLCLDSGASDTFINSNLHLSSHRQTQSPMTVTLPNGIQEEISTQANFKGYNVLYAPNFKNS